MKTALQKAIEQIGEDAVRKSIPSGYKFGNCDLHGKYLVAGDSQASCPICPSTPPANGDAASEVEHYIDVREAVGMDGTNPGQKVNPYGI